MRITSFKATVLAVIFFFTLRLHAAGPEADGMVVNGGFEHADLVAWSWGSKADATLSIDRTERHSGASSVKITNDSARAPNVFGLLRQKVAVKPDTRYRISVWMKGRGVSKAGSFTNAWIGGGYGWKIRQPLPAGTYDWRRVSKDITTRSGESVFDLLILVEGPVEALWVDDVEMVELGSAPTASVEPDDGRLHDGGFESPASGAWVWGASGGADASFLLDGSEKHSGRYSAFLRGKGEFGAGKFGKLSQRVAGLKPGQEYEISMWVKARGTAGWFGGGPGWALRRNFPVGAYDWQRVTTRFTADGSGAFELMLLVTRAVEGLWIDDVEINPAVPDDQVSVTEPAVWDYLPASAGFYPVLKSGRHGVAPRLRLKDDPLSDASGGVRVTYDRDALHFEFSLDGVSKRVGMAMLTLALPGKDRRPGERQRFSFRTSSDGTVKGRALIAGQEWLSTEVADERPFDWSRTVLAATRTDGGCVTRVSLPWQALEPGLTEPPAEVGADVILSAESPDGFRQIGRWMVPTNDDARGRETLARLVLVKGVPASVAWLKLPTKARSSRDALVGQYWDYAFAARPPVRAEFDFTSKAGRTIMADDQLPALDAGHTGMVSFRVPGGRLDEAGDYRIDVKTGAKGAIGEISASGLFARLDFAEQVAPALKIVKQRLESVRARLDERSEMKADSYVMLGLAVADRFVKRLDDIGAGRLGQKEEWSVLQVGELGRVMDFLEARVARAGPPEVVARPGDGHLAIENGGLVARDSKTDKTRPVYAYGYGHFATAAKDLPFFSKIGAALIEQERGPREMNEDGSVKPQTSLLRTLDEATANGMKVDLLLSPHYFPGWALKQNPELGAVRPAGFLRHDIDHPKDRWVIEKWIRGVMKQVGENPALFSVGLSNEPMWTNSGYDPVSRARWTAFLRRQHGDVEGLNKTYGSAYERLEDVPVDEPAGGMDAKDLAERRRYFDWIVFNQENFAAWHHWMNGLVKEVAPGVPTHVKMMPLIFSRSTLRLGVDPELIAGTTDFAGNDAGTPLEGDDGFAYGWHRMEIWYDLLNSFNGQPVYNSENHLIRDNSPAESIPAAHTYASLWQGALHNLAATAIWVWEPTGGNTALAGGIYMRPANILAAGRAMLDVNRLAGPLGKVSRAPASVAILYSIPSIFWNKDYLRLLIAAHEALTLGGHRVTFISERQLAEGKRSPANRDVDWIILPQATHVADATVNALDAFSKSGGRLLAIGDGNLAFDPYDHARSLPDNLKMTRLADSSSTKLAEELRGEIPETDPLLSPDGSAVTGVEYREVNDGGRLLVSLTNMLAKPVTVRLPWGGATIHDLIGESAVTGDSLTLAPMVPVLLEVTGRASEPR